MDILIPLLLMAIFYVGPGLLKRYRAQINPQPTVPERINTEMLSAPPNNKTLPAYMGRTSELQSTMVAGKGQSAPAVVEEQLAWRGKLDQNMIINGVIFAEILQAPRAYRPFRKR